MSTAQFIEEFKTLPENIKQEVADFAAFLKYKSELDVHNDPRGQRYKPGLGKGKFSVSPDFDEPIPGFEDYM